ncbi:hypothetical protein V493_05487 [Pseudogymnoascus sp. VKM F-4281 (FW-2241)]|nr:hypothetical protein V493_05487 [Pseudogymnoascus sp. VKM F-4281 (FW-2241)]
MAYNQPDSMEYKKPTQSYNPLSPPPNTPTNTPSTGYSCATLPSSSAPSPSHEEPTQKPTQEDIDTPAVGLECYSEYDADSDPEDTEYHPPPTSPFEPSLEYQEFAHDYPSKYDEDTDTEDTEFTPTSTRSEPSLEYATSCPSESDSGSESEDELASRGRPRKREYIWLGNFQEVKEVKGHAEPEGGQGVKAEEPTSAALESSLKESLVALGVRELRKVAEDNEKKRETPRWRNLLHNFVVLVVVFLCAVATVWVINEVHYRSGLPHVNILRGYVCSDSIFGSVLILMIFGEQSKDWEYSDADKVAEYEV